MTPEYQATYYDGVRYIELTRWTSAWEAHTTSERYIQSLHMPYVWNEYKDGKEGIEYSPKIEIVDNITDRD